MSLPQDDIRAPQTPASAAPFAEFDSTPLVRAEPLRPRRRRRIGRWVGTGLLVALVAGLLVAAPWDPQRRQAYADQWVVWTEPPGAHVERLAEELALTETGRRVFFASRPLVDDAAEFQEHCPVEADIVLGCYGDGRIYVYSVTDDRLAGTVEATAAHELLHAVYARMSDDDRRRVDALVAGFVATLPSTDPNVATVEGYPAAQRPDEWHSRLGTGYDDLPAELTAHYAEVFADRSPVIAFESGRTSELDGYTSQIDQLSAELDAGYAELERRSAAYDAALAELDDDIDDFNARAHGGGFATQKEFDAARAALLARQEALEADRVKLNADVDSYNDKLTQLEKLDAERAELYSQLDSRTAPTP